MTDHPHLTSAAALFTAVIFPARITCNDCTVTAVVLDIDQGTRWLLGHGNSHHDGPFEVGVWNKITDVNEDVDELRQRIREWRL